MDRIRKQLEALLGITLDAGAWSFLEHEGYLADLLAGKRSVSDVLDAAHGWWRHTPWRRDQPPVLAAAVEEHERPPIKQPTPPAVRQEVLGTVLAEQAYLDAQGDPRLDGALEQIHEALRQGGHLLHPGEVGQWIADHAMAQPRPTVWLGTFAIPDERREMDRDQAIRALAKTLQTDIAELWASVELHLLRFHVTDDQQGQAMQERVIATHAGSVLEALHRVSAAWSRAYGWTEAQVVDLLLTGREPAPHLVVATAQINQRVPVASRISLTIDPAASLRDVTDAYMRVRTQVVGTRHKDLTEKHLRLAAFAARLRKSSGIGERWVDLMRMWNERYPEWAYTRDTQFARDYGVAVRRLLQREYHPL